MTSDFERALEAATERERASDTARSDVAARVNSIAQQYFQTLIDGGRSAYNILKKAGAEEFTVCSDEHGKKPVGRAVVLQRFGGYSDAFGSEGPFVLFIRSDGQPMRCTETEPEKGIFGLRRIDGLAVYGRCEDLGINVQWIRDTYNSDRVDARLPKSCATGFYINVDVETLQVKPPPASDDPTKWLADLVAARLKSL